MTITARMEKQIPGSGVISLSASKLFNRHISPSKFRGFASFGDKEDVSVLLEVADTPEAQAKGLMGRTKVPICCGMLFPNLQGGHFWMKGCFIPLDIVFLDKDNKITKMYTMAADGGKKRYPYGNAKTAIELQAGFCEKFGLYDGMKCSWRIWK